MNSAPAWDLLRVVRAGFLTLMTIALAALFGGALVPLTHQFVVDALLWLLLAGGGAVWHLRAAYRFRKREAVAAGLDESVLETLADVAYEVMALVSGGFFGALFAVLTRQEYAKSGLGGNTPLMLGLALVCLLAFLVALRRALGYLRSDAAHDDGTHPHV